ncbi:Maf family protein [Sporosarcina sp. CAU 1771]
MKFTTQQTIVLASGSPRRKELFSTLGVPFEVVVSDMPEDKFTSDLSFIDYAQSLAISKASAVAKKYPEAVVIGADTIVVFKDRVFPKPKNEAEAKRFLRELSGRTHSVITSVAVRSEGGMHVFSIETSVTFYTLDDALIDAYVASGDPLDKAGVYGIQSGGALLVEGIQGDYYAVMGLPLAELTRHLRHLGILLLEGEGPTSDE